MQQCAVNRKIEEGLEVPFVAEKLIMALRCGTFAALSMEKNTFKKNYVIMKNIRELISWRCKDDFNAGYMWHNLLNCKIIYDKEGRLTKVQQKYKIPYL